MKQQSGLKILVPLIGILGFAAACAGLFWPGGDGGYAFTSLRGQETDIFGRGLYQYDTLMVASGFQGTDMITLFIGLPLLYFAFRGYLHGRLLGGLVMAGALSFFLYNGISMSFAAAYNPFFLVYVSLMSASLFALVMTIQAIAPSIIGKHLSESMSRGWMATYFMISGASVLLLWGSEIAASWQTGLMPEFLASYSTTVTHGLDMGVIAPLAFLSASLVLKGKPDAVRFGFPLALLNILIGLCVISQTVMQLRAGVEFSTGQLIGMVGAWIILAGFAAWTVVSMARQIHE
jgi:hypothetical protein